jgi:uncharacterized protein YodC (DUF2158 family)
MTRIGDTVQLTIGGPPMLVMDMATACPIPRALCVWYYLQVPQREWIPLACLRIHSGTARLDAPPDDGMPPLTPDGDGGYLDVGGNRL